MTAEEGERHPCNVQYKNTKKLTKKQEQTLFKTSAAGVYKVLLI